MLKETINSKDFTKGLKDHFSTKSSIKNMLYGKKNMKAIQPLFEDGKYAEEILGYGNIEDSLAKILDDVFKEYIKGFEKKKSNKELGNVRDRVQFFIGLFDERLNKEPEGGIVSSFADFAKSATGKKIAKILKDSGNESNEDLMDIIAYIAIRSLIINCDNESEPTLTEDSKSEPLVVVTEPVVVEPVTTDTIIEVEAIPVENHSHTKVEPKESESTDLVDSNDIFKDILRNPIGYEDDRIRSVVNMVFPDGGVSGTLLDKINSYPTRSECYDIADVIEYQLPPIRKAYIGSINISSFIRCMLSISALDKGDIENESNTDILAASYLVFAALNIILDESISCRNFVSEVIITMKRLVQNDDREFKKLPNLISNISSNIDEEQTASIFARMRAYSISTQILRDSAISRMNEVYKEFGIA